MPLLGTTATQLGVVVREPLPGPRAQEILALDRRFVSPSYTRPYPLVAQRGQGALVEDIDGNCFLDFSAGIAVVATGHCHPRIVAAIQKQAGQLIHMSGSDFYYEHQVRLAQKLAQIAPGGGDKKVFFSNSGTEAVEAAIKLSRRHTKRQKLIAFTGSFHGRTLGALSLTASKPIQRQGFGPLIPGVFHAPFPDPYRRANDLTAEEQGLRAARYIETELFRSVAPKNEVAAIVVEPIQGEGGYIFPHPAFLLELRRIADDCGALLVFDEVQSGMGRTGKMWAAEHFEVSPDIIAVAKGIASGMPLGATIASSDIMDWPPGAHGSTFGGNPVSIAAALETIALLEEELIENAARVGSYILEKIASWPERYHAVGHVRGLGLMIGIELVTDQETREPASELRDQIVQMAFHKGLLILGCGRSTIRLSPPLMITSEQADFALSVIEQLLQEQDTRQR